LPCPAKSLKIFAVHNFSLKGLGPEIEFKYFDINVKHLVADATLFDFICFWLHTAAVVPLHLRTNGGGINVDL
jgi:hypothetical protein